MPKLVLIFGPQAVGKMTVGQELSKITRHFVYEATGIKVHNYTLQEIKGTNLSGLYSIISECYTPEFSVDKNGDIYGSITKARKVIEEWN